VKTLKEAAADAVRAYDQWVEDVEAIMGRQPKTMFMDSLRQAIDRLGECDPEAGWISVEERLPEVGESVLVVRHGGDVWVSSFRDLQYYSHPERCKKWDTPIFGCEDGITHWQPLPSPPPKMGKL